MPQDDLKAMFDLEAETRRQSEIPRPDALPGPYVTTLKPSDEKDFQSWVKENKIPWRDDPKSDYDMRGFWSAQKSGDPEAKRAANLHFPDTYKTPYHKSFSNESKYATSAAPKWKGNQLIDRKGNVVFDEDAQKEKNMPNDGGVAEKLAGAKKTLDSANKFEKSAGGPIAKPAPVAKAPEKKSSGVLDGLKKFAAEQSNEADSTIEGLKAKKANIDAYNKSIEKDSPALPKMHKGGVVKKDGPHNLKKGEVVLTEKDAKKKGVKDGMADEKESKAEKKSEGGDSKKAEKKELKHKFGRTEIEHHPNGSHTVRHHFRPMAMKDGMAPQAQEPVSYSVPDNDGLKAGIDENLGGEAPAQAAAPQQAA